MLRISQSVSITGMDEAARRIALEMLSVLAVKPGDFLKTSKFSSVFPGVDADEVDPGIFIGNKLEKYFFNFGNFVIRESATNLEFLRSLEISHVLNSAEGKKPGCVDTSQECETIL